MIRAIVSQSDLKKMKEHLIKNVHWGTVVALTRTVNQIRDEAKIEIHKFYHIRNQWVPGSIRSTTAMKGSLSATVGTIQRFLLEHETGGQRHSTDKNRTEGVPEYARNNSSEKTTMSRWPRVYMARNRKGLEHFGPRQPGMRNKGYPVYGPQRPFYSKHKRGGTGTKGKFYGSKARGGGRYFYLDVMGRSGPLRLLIQRMSKSGKKGSKNRVWYVVLEGGRIHLKHNLMWESMVPRVIQVFSERITVELTKALSHGRTLP